MDRLLAAILGCPVGFLILYFRRAVREFIGNVGFAEQYLGPGGTNTFVVIVGVLVFIGSLMYSLGTLQSLLNNTLGIFFK